VIILAGNVRSEYSLWTTQLMNNISSEYLYNSTVQDHIFYQFDDTSIEDVGKNKPIALRLFYSIQPLPYVLTGYGGEVDWCSLVVRHFKNIYDSDGNRINTSIEYTNMNFSTNASSDYGYLDFDMRSDDTISGDIYCHYSNVSTLYVENVLVGRWTTFLPSFECKGCSDYTLEELSNEIERSDEIYIQQTQIYLRLQDFVELDFKVWLILKWIIYIAFLFVAIGLLLYSGYYFYSLIKRLESEI
jgi:hypothetical protein